MLQSLLDLDPCLSERQNHNSYFGEYWLFLSNCKYYIKCRGMNGLNLIKVMRKNSFRTYFQEKQNTHVSEVKKILWLLIFLKRRQMFLNSVLLPFYLKNAPMNNYIIKFISGLHMHVVMFCHGKFRHVCPFLIN